MSQKTILVVDDEKLPPWSLRQKLESSGFYFEEAGTGEVANTLFQSLDSDLVTLDIRFTDTLRYPVKKYGLEK